MTVSVIRAFFGGICRCFLPPAMAILIQVLGKPLFDQCDSNRFGRQESIPTWLDEKLLRKNDHYSHVLTLEMITEEHDGRDCDRWY